MGSFYISQINQFFKNSSKQLLLPWIKFRDAEKVKEFDQLVLEENLRMPETQELVDKIFRIGTFEVSDAEISNIMPPTSRFGAGNMDARLAKKEHIMERLNNFFMKYYD